ncbi:MAG: hypothetical protein M3164_00380 [Actinomycetota bacterium]|nr:hypothetical protein [Actinomycetota bacterium]
MEAALVGLAVLVLGIWIALPLLRRRKGRDEAYEEVDEAMERLVESKHSVYRSILDLELEHKLGKLDDNEYRQMRAQSEAEALELIALSEPSEGGARPYEEILEEEIREARRRLRSRS